MSRNAGNSGHQLKSSETVELGGRSAYCLEFERDKKQPRLIMGCAIEGSDIFVTYAGDSRYLPDVFNMLHNMFPATAARSFVTHT
jgi:hypothetical protein